MRVIAIGASSGGSAALKTLLAPLTVQYSVPIVVVKHHGMERPRLDEDMVHWLNRQIALTVELAEDKMPVLPGKVYVAPHDYHLLLNRDGTLSLSQDEPVIYTRPSVDVLFESVADACGSNAVGVVLTGASKDGSAGARAIREQGGQVWVQSPETAEAPVMPRGALADSDTKDAMSLAALTARLAGLQGE